MAKRPILTDDELDAGIGEGFSTPIPDRSSGVTRPLDGPLAAPSSGTRPVDPPEVQPNSPGALGRDASGHARPKTRIHGLGTAKEIEEKSSAPSMTATPMTAPPVVGWLVITTGPGRGASCGLIAGMNAVGRGDDTHVQLDFGDDSISRDAHAYVTYDNEARRFYVSHGGKTNLVRRNNTPVLTTEDLAHGDTIRIGATSLRFVALCGPEFDWSDT